MTHKLKLVGLFLFLFATGLCQQYVDLAKVSFAHLPQLNFSDENAPPTSLNNVAAAVTLPIKLTDSTYLISGFNYAYHQLKLKPNTDVNSFQMYGVKLGINKMMRSKWSVTYLAQARMNGDFGGAIHQHFQIGALAIWKYHKNEQQNIYFGGYVNKDIFGGFSTPIFGIYHLSKNKKLELDIMLPIIGHVNYEVFKNVKVGADFLGVVRSYQLSETNNYPSSYVHNTFTEYSGFLQFEFFNRSILLQTKLVFAVHDYGLYNNSDKVNFGITGFYFGNNRTRLNPETNGALGMRVGLVYRYHK